MMCTIQIPINTLLISVMFLVSWMKTVRGHAFKRLLFPYIHDQIFINCDGRQSTKKRHIAMQSTIPMRELLEMFSMHYEKIPLKTVDGEAICKKAKVAKKVFRMKEPIDLTFLTKLTGLIWETVVLFTINQVKQPLISGTCRNYGKYDPVMLQDNGRLFES